MSKISPPSRLVLPTLQQKNGRSPISNFSTPMKNNLVLQNITNSPSNMRRRVTPNTTPKSNGANMTNAFFNDQQKKIQNNNVKVITRFRPFNEAELLSQSERVVRFQKDTNSLTITMNQHKQQLGFTFDKVFEEDTSQLEFYQYSIVDTVEDLFKGFNGTILCYGQTGSGKTYSMMGNIDNKETRGIIPRIGEQIFDMIAEQDSDIEYTVGVSYLEVYNEKLKDLLNPGEDLELKIIEDKINGIHVKNLSHVYISGKHEIYDLMNQGNLRKIVSATNMNEESSRSHSIFQINLKQLNTTDGTTKFSKLYLVDLAGSEKIDKTGATGQTLEEAKKINASLSSLGNVINALTDGKSTHIPYRDSKLTRILQESLGGNSRTTLIVNCSCSSMNDQETLSTLRFGARAKNIKNHAHINEEMSNVQLHGKIDSLTKEKEEDRKLIKHLQEEITRLNRGSLSDGTNSDTTIVDEEIPSLMDRLSVKELEDNSKDQQLISLKLRNVELETANESILHDLTTEIARNVELQVQNADLIQDSKSGPVDRKLIVKLEKNFEKLTLKFSNVQNKNNDLMKTIKDLEKLIKSKNSKLSSLEGLLNQQEEQIALLKSNNSPSSHYNLKNSKMSSYHSSSSTTSSPELRRNGRVGLNLKIMKPIKGGETR